MRWQHGIEVSGEGCPPPLQEFTELELPPRSVAELQRLGYDVCFLGLVLYVYTCTYTCMLPSPCITVYMYMYVLHNNIHVHVHAYVIITCISRVNICPHYIAAPNSCPNASNSLHHDWQGCHCPCWDCELSCCISNAMDAARVLSSAKQGSGKTLAYCLPMCHLLPLFPPVQPGLCLQFSTPLTIGRTQYLHAGRSVWLLGICVNLVNNLCLVCALFHLCLGEGPRALIMAPTRELAQQVW